MKAKVFIIEKFGYWDQQEEKIVDEYDQIEVSITIGDLTVENFTGVTVESAKTNAIDYLKRHKIFDYEVIYRREIRTWVEIVITDSDDGKIFEEIS